MPSWDKLRGAVPTTKTYIGLGKFQHPAGSRVEVVPRRTYMTGDRIGLRVGLSSNSACYWSPCALRELAAFCTELADQLDAGVNPETVVRSEAA